MYGDDTIDMGMSQGPMMEGTWYNPDNGDSFTVRDTYFEGDHLYIIATDGRRFDGDMISRYVQTNDPISQKPQIDPNQGKIGKDLLAGMDAEMQNEINSLIGGPQITEDPLNSTLVSTGPKPQPKLTVVEDEDELLLRRMMDRVAPPKVTCSIKWTKFPSKQMEMLDMLGVPQEKVIDYILQKLDMETIMESIKQALVKSFADTEEKEKKSK